MSWQPICVFEMCSLSLICGCCFAVYCLTLQCTIWFQSVSQKDTTYKGRKFLEFIKSHQFTRKWSDEIKTGVGSETEKKVKNILKENNKQMKVYTEFTQKRLLKQQLSHILMDYLGCDFIETLVRQWQLDHIVGTACRAGRF